MAWAFTILRNRFLNEFVAKRRLTRELSAGDLERVAIRAQQEEGLELADLRRIFYMLPEEQRSILSLVVGSRLPYEEVARVLSCAEGTVKSRMHRARAALRALMEEQMDFVPVPPSATSRSERNRIPVSSLETLSSFL
jgi:RNA polymerase sigma-70 factor (ECF subfamily)